jgi:hypothetical protein
VRNLTTTPKRVALNKAKIKRAQKLLGTKTDSETIDRALDEVISDQNRSARAWAATERFIKSGAEIRDVFGRLTSAQE